MNIEPLHVPELLRRFHLRPKKSLGQNFLADHNALLKIVRESEISAEDHILEIGAGLGGLTRLLAVHAKAVTAIEIDQDLFPALEAVTQPFKNVRLIQGDILEIRPADLFIGGGYKVVANIPYYITSAVVRRLLEAQVRPDRIVLTMQREVAERIVNQDKKMSLLSLSVQVYGEAHIASHIPAACFYPQPQVDSSVLIIDVYEQPRVPEDQMRLLFRLAHAAFNQKRKMLRSSLRSVLAGDLKSTSSVLENVGIDPSRRPESLSLEDWIRLTEVVKSLSS